MYGLFLATYLPVGVVVSLFAQRRTLRVGEPQRFDDWCIAVEQVHHTNDQREAVYDVTLRYFNRARGRPQRERNVTVYLIDEHGHRDDPDSSPSTVPFDRVVPAGESVTAARVIKTPPDARIKRGRCRARRRIPDHLVHHRRRPLPQAAARRDAVAQLGGKFDGLP
jgi:hypothetical protein